MCGVSALIACDVDVLQAKERSQISPRSGVVEGELHGGVLLEGPERRLDRLPHEEEAAGVDGRQGRHQKKRKNSRLRYNGDVVNLNLGGSSFSSLSPQPI